MKPTIFFLLLFIYGCQVQHINQKKDRKLHGRWIEEYTLDTIQYKSVGNYKKGEPIKKWNYYANAKIIKKETYKKNHCKVLFYHPNGKIQAKGTTRLVSQPNQQMHWFYSGKWHYFDTNGRLILTRFYNNGELISEQETKKQ